MKKIFSFGFLLLLMGACSNENNSGKPENDVDAARMFIRSALDGNYKEARKLIVEDSANVEWLTIAERSYLQNNDVSEQRGLREASINVHDVRKINDSTTVVVFSNSYKKKRDSVKAVKRNGEWRIDLKYTFQPHADTTSK